MGLVALAVSHLGGPWPFKGAKVPRPSAVRLCKITYNNTLLLLDYQHKWSLSDVRAVSFKNVLKGSYDVAKNNIILCIWCNAMCLFGLRFKNTLFSTYCTLLLLLYAPPFWNASIFTKLIVLRSEACADWPAIQWVVIGRIPQAWDGNVTPPYHVVMPCPSAMRLKQ